MKGIKYTHRLTPHSLYAAVSVVLQTEAIFEVCPSSILGWPTKTKVSAIQVLKCMPAVLVPDSIMNSIHKCTLLYGTVKIVLNYNE